MHPAATADASTAASEMRSAAKMGTAAATAAETTTTAAAVETATTAAVETATTAAAVETTTTAAAAASSGRGVSGTDQRSGQSNDGKDFEP
jgi:hypothetical protein